MYESVSLATRAKIRRLFLPDLKKPYTHIELARKIRTHRSTTSRTILASEKRGLIKCRAPDKTMGRHCGMTKKERFLLRRPEE